MTETVSISNLIQDLSTRSGRAILSQLGLRSSALREYLERLYAREPGKPGSLLADPVLEAAFGWKLAEVDMQGLARSGAIVKSGVRGVVHAAALRSSMTSMPSLNRTPSMTLARCRKPRSRRQDFSAHRPIL